MEKVKNMKGLKIRNNTFRCSQILIQEIRSNLTNKLFTIFTKI